MISIVCDTSGDLSVEDARNLDITLIPIHIAFGENSFQDRFEITPEVFYNKLEHAKELPTTAQVAPAEFLSVFEDTINKGNEVIAIVLSSNLSGTYQSALIAKEMCSQPEKISVVDSKSATGGISLLTHVAASRRDQGISRQNIVEELERIVPKVRILGNVKTMRYLHMGGRVSSTQYALGNALNIIPIITVENGYVEVIAKKKGWKSACKYMALYLEKHPRNLKYPVLSAHALNREGLESAYDSVEKYISKDEFIEYTLSPTIGTHTGPGAVALIYVEE